MGKKDENMKKFIEVAYSVVFGVNFYKFFGDGKTLPSLNNFSDICNHFTSEKLFYFLLFLLTVLIVAHDWYTYYSTDKSETRTQAEKNEIFWIYVPQLFSLVFIAQMFSAVCGHNFKWWYLFGFAYTICNIGTLAFQWKLKPENVRKLMGLKYLIHLGIAGLGAFFLCYFPGKFESVYGWYYLFFVPTAVIVIWLWFKEPKKIEQQQTSQQNKPVIQTLQDIKALVGKVQTQTTQAQTQIDQVKINLETIKKYIDNIDSKL